MLRNLSTSNNRPPRPTRCCRNRAGPGEVSRTTHAIKSMGTVKTANTDAETTMSKHRRRREPHQVLTGTRPRHLRNAVSSSREQDGSKNLKASKSNSIWMTRLPVHTRKPGNRTNAQRKLISGCVSIIRQISAGFHTCRVSRVIHFVSISSRVWNLFVQNSLNGVTNIAAIYHSAINRYLRRAQASRTFELSKISNWYK